MEFLRKVQPSRKLTTKGCCFLCLKNEEISQTKDYAGNQVVKSTSVKSLLRYLQIKSQSLNGRSLVGQNLNKEDIQVDLCENCGQMISRFSVLYQKLEKIQLEMDYFLEGIRNSISQSAKDPELVQNYSKRMTSDLEALSQLAFVDNLRKSVSKKCLKGLNVPRLQVTLNRETSRLIKMETTITSSEKDDGDIPGSVDSGDESFSNLASPPPSPNSTEAHQLNFRKSSEKLFPSLKQPGTGKAKKSKYFTKHLSTGMYECNRCDRKSKCSQTIEYHFKSVHLKLTFKCDICNVSVFRRLFTLTMHKKTCREKVAKKLEKDPKFKFICKICGKSFETRKKLGDHTRWVHKYANRYQCDLCGKKYTSKFALKYHTGAIHQSRELPCKGCNKIYTDLGRYKQHVKKCVGAVKVKLETVECE